MSILGIISFIGMILLAIVAIFDHLKSASLKLNIYLHFFASIGVILLGFFPLFMILREKYGLRSIYFWLLLFISILLMGSGLVRIYNLHHDLKEGTIKEKIKIISAKRHKRKNKRGGDYFTFKTGDKIFEVDYFDYFAIKDRLEKKEYATALVEYYRKTQIIKKLDIEKD